MSINKVGFKRKFRKYFEYFFTKVKLLIEQKKFKYDKTTLKYMLKEVDSDKLIVIFSAYTRKGIRARYNYVRTLKDVNCNQLFILDDFAADHRGGYYIGGNYEFNDEKATIELIKYVQNKLNIAKTIYCGSSKGGWSALNFGFQFPDSVIITGGPQYYLGDYLIEHKNFDTLDYIIGERTDDKINKLNNYLKERINNNKYVDSQEIFIHYSNKEHTYEEHIKDMLEEMNKMNYKIIEDIADYPNHSDISYYFPDYLLNTIKRNI